MQTRKIKHKGKFWRDDEVYGEQMHHFISRLSAEQRVEREPAFNDRL